ncbi:MAG: hypothetical protein FJW39_29355 [Acidobacteria bacterium]|nr:hypothetical protein [Acidobacteriota bacterium]
MCPVAQPLIKESFELVKDYSQKTGQDKALKAEPWYHFGRIIRNALSHNFDFELKDREKSLLPVSWRNRTITLAMNNQPLTLDFFGYIEAWELFSDFHEFAHKRLS